MTTEAEEAQWRPLADALMYAMTETGVEPDPQFVQETAQSAVLWLNHRDYWIHNPGPPGL